ncbi:Hypothetical predicted protein [Mytilus galloprovincialis]|uniref:Farnesoic acid O-methyl transferase domain-containing protein n=1 Tax=Mytilus galloprovincialis TaxID=29158 RepID=A0A8B6C611_MYTGA|nr:Hypothetical predicted protein [Mytilus galloprovincialis]
MEITTTDHGQLDGLLNPTIYLYYTRLSAYGIVPSSEQYIVVDVKSCGDAFVLLSASPNLVSDNFYELGFDVLSGFKFLFRRKSGTSYNYKYSKTIHGQKLLNCVEYRPFWISWNFGNIRVGKGNAVNFGTFYQWEDPNPVSIEGVGIMSVHNGSTADWKFNNSSSIEANGRYTKCGERADMQSVATWKVKHRFACTVKCNTHDNCIGYSYNNKTTDCVLIAGNQMIKSIDDHDWVFYIKCLEGPHRCIYCG